MFSHTLLALLANLRWPELSSLSNEELNDLFAQVWSTLRQHLPTPEDRLQILEAATDVVLFSAFLQEREPAVAHYAAALKSLHIYGLERISLETAAYGKVLAQVRQADTRETITSLLQRLPEVLERRRTLGRPAKGSNKQSMQIRKRHLDLNASLVERVEAAFKKEEKEQLEENAASGNFTIATEEGLFLWLLIGTDA
ncbi:hypothetical protein KSF_107610 [Reticulibacter mediterranei]|uniref:Uncharacterized protein n=1 Tax=Reticulibacter mediterranei TaxID=2778369 RepID=A0A8J3IU93_9CHLR|nr:hypothetical protein [Reticulibacter mediterranei]GHP00714.1 hypothetical protein KSF_107610 [Reticulibacter mediterranei]